MDTITYPCWDFSKKGSLLVIVTATAIDNPAKCITVPATLKMSTEFGIHTYTCNFMLCYQQNWQYIS